MSKYALPLKGAEARLKEEGRLQSLLKRAIAKAQSNRDRLGEVWEDLQTLMRLLHAYITGRYRVVPWKTLVRIVAAVLYFVNPFDFIPDFLPVLGFIDDISVIGFAVVSVKSDIELFRDWETKTSEPLDLQSDELVDGSAAGWPRG